jgi:hypothetical protein
LQGCPTSSHDDRRKTLQTHQQVLQRTSGLDDLLHALETLNELVDSHGLVAKHE